MPDITVNIPTGVATRVADAFIGSYPPPSGVGVSTGAAKLAYVRSLLMAHIKAVVAGYEATQAAVTAQKTAADKAAAEVVLT